MSQSKIVNVPEKMEKYYGKGTMLHPAPEEIEELIKTIPLGKMTTIDTLCKKLAHDFGTDITCPMRTGNALKKIAESNLDGNANEDLPFWRVVRTDQLMIKSKEYETWAPKIEDEGFDLNLTKAGAIKVDFKPDALFHF